MSNFVANITVVCRLCSRHWGSTSVVYAGCSLLSKLTLKWHTLHIILTCLKKNKQSQIASWRWPRQKTTKLDELGCKQSQVMLSWKQNTLNKEHPTRTGARLEPHLREAEKSIARVCPNWVPGNLFEGSIVFVNAKSHKNELFSSMFCNCPMWS